MGPMQSSCSRTSRPLSVSECRSSAAPREAPHRVAHGTAAQFRPAPPRADEAAVKRRLLFHIVGHRRQNFPNMIFEGCLWGIIAPSLPVLAWVATSSSTPLAQAIGDIFGHDEKIRVAGQMATAQTARHSPFSGMSMAKGLSRTSCAARFSDYLRWTLVCGTPALSLYPVR